MEDGLISDLKLLVIAHHREVTFYTGDISMEDDVSNAMAKVSGVLRLLVV